VLVLLINGIHCHKMSLIDHQYIPSITDWISTTTVYCVIMYNCNVSELWSGLYRSRSASAVAEGHLLKKIWCRNVSNQYMLFVIPLISSSLNDILHIFLFIKTVLVLRHIITCLNVKMSPCSEGDMLLLIVYCCVIINCHFLSNDRI